jgi:hypothetical protein
VVRASLLEDGEKWVHDINVDNQAARERDSQ